MAVARPYRPSPVVMSRARPTSISLSGRRRSEVRSGGCPRPSASTGDIEAWLAAEYATTVRSISVRSGPTGDERLLVDLHPAARAGRDRRAASTGQVDVTVETVFAGPGYHRFVGRVLERLGQELSIEWPAPSDDPSAAASFSDRATTEHDYLGWLGSTLADVRAARRPTRDRSISAPRRARRTRSAGRSPPSLDLATTHGSMPRSPIRVVRSTSCPGGLTRPTGERS